MTWVFLAWIIAIGLGLGFKVYLMRTKSEIHFPAAFIAAVVVSLFFTSWLVTHVGSKMSVQNAVTFNENWGGFEVKARWEKFERRGQNSGAHFWYKCDEWTHWHTETYTTTDGKGNTTTHTRQVPHEHYEACPYVTEEWHFYIDTTLGTYDLGWAIPADWEKYMYRGNGAEHHSPPSSAFRGVPPFWQAAHDRIERGDPGPVVKRMTYENYILASQKTILKQYSDRIKFYRDSKLMPDLSRDPVHNHYEADKAFFVGVNPPGNWQFELNQFNAALGMDLQGDMYVVIVDSSKVTDPDDYMMALISYWTSDEHFGKDALAKNGIVVVLGTKDGKTVEWARAKTGMPAGNEAMFLDIHQDLPGTALTTDAVLGHPRAERLYKKPGKDYYSVDIAHGSGALEKVIWGENKFDRICMKCDDPNETSKVGYQYLKNEIQPSSLARFLMIFISFIIGAAAWFGVFYFCNPGGFPTTRVDRSSRSRWPY